MDLEAVRSWLEKGGQIASMVDGLPSRLLEPFVISDLRIDQIEPGRVLCSMKIPTRLLVLINLFQPKRNLFFPHINEDNHTLTHLRKIYIISICGFV